MYTGFSLKLLTLFAKLFSIQRLRPERFLERMRFLLENLKRRACRFYAIQQIRYWKQTEGVLSRLKGGYYIQMTCCILNELNGGRKSKTWAKQKRRTMQSTQEQSYLEKNCEKIKAKQKKEKKKQNHNLLNKQTQTAPKPRSSTSPPFFILPFNPSERQGATTIYGGVTKKTLTSFQGQLSSCLNGGLVIRLLATK